jgi:hypothetical protein
VTSSFDDIGGSPSAGWRFKLGILIFVLAFAVWLLVPLAAGFGASTARIAALSGVIFVANKILLVICVAVMGKAGFQQLKTAAFGYARSLSSAETVGPTRYAIGLVMFCLPLLTAMLDPYIDLLWPDLMPNAWQFRTLGDLMLLVSFFVLGGDFWNKIQALFVRTARVVDAGSTDL